MDLLTQTARLWRSLGHHDAQGRFHIDGVTGPDEYSALADDNVYTNLMARHNLLAAAETAKRYPDRARELGIDLEESASWRDAAEHGLRRHAQRRQHAQLALGRRDPGGREHPSQAAHDQDPDAQ